jgi:hypothetical protein
MTTLRNAVLPPLLFCCFLILEAQNKTNTALLEAYTSYFESPREYVHVHLNKIKLIEGEPLGFTAYVFNAYADFATYISSKDFEIRKPLTLSAGTSILQISNLVANNIRELDPPLIILDGIILTDFNILYAFDTDTVDYIEIDKSGSIMGMRGANGVIRIVTNPGRKLSQKSFKEVQDIAIPLKFSKAERYYTPKYQFYDTAFYEKFGVVDWFPNLELEHRGAVNFNFNTMKNKDFILFIEGFVNGEDFISEIKTLSLN